MSEKKLGISTVWVLSRFQKVQTQQVSFFLLQSGLQLSIFVRLTEYTFKSCFEEYTGFLSGGVK